MLDYLETGPVTGRGKVFSAKTDGNIMFSVPAVFRGRIKKSGYKVYFFMNYTKEKNSLNEGSKLCSNLGISLPIHTKKYFGTLAMLFCS
jgi:hypothetical protein